MNILIACEESGIVRETFNKRGHNAWSCDLLPTAIPGKHIRWNVSDILHEWWDMLIAFPPCTYLSNAGIGAFKNNPGRFDDIKKGAEFFNKLLNCNIPKIAVENPIHHGHARKLIRKYDQIIQPYYFGDPETKSTCLWLKNLPKLQHNKSDGLFWKKTHVDINFHGLRPDGRRYCWNDKVKGNGEARAKLRSRTFQGFAEAMAEQWG